MPISTTSKHTASLTVPVSGDPADRIVITPAPDGRSVTFSMESGVSAAEAKGKIRDFLQAARDAAQN